MKLLLLGILLLQSIPALAGSCKIVANPDSEWEKNGGVVFAPWVDRESKLESVSLNDCIETAVKELNISYDGHFPIKNVKYKFVENGVQVKGKVNHKK